MSHFAFDLSVPTSHGLWAETLVIYMKCQWLCRIHWREYNCGNVVRAPSSSKNGYHTCKVVIIKFEYKIIAGTIIMKLIHVLMMAEQQCNQDGHLFMIVHADLFILAFFWKWWRITKVILILAENFICCKSQYSNQQPRMSHHYTRLTRGLQASEIHVIHWTLLKFI